MTTLVTLLLLIVAGMAAKTLWFSFRAQKPGDYAETGSDFPLRTSLSGRIASEGLIYGPTGRMTNSFTAVMEGTWDGDTGTLSEDFTYSNGRTQQRKWYLKMGKDNRFTATADDIIGEAHGEISGATVRMTYKIVLPPQAGGHVLSVTDWMYLTRDGVIMNRSEMRKFGLKVAELVATMRPEPQTAPQSSGA